MPLSNGCNHVTLITKDIARLIDFYERNFDAEVRLDLDEGGLRHALIDLGRDFSLHPFQLSNQNPHADAIPDIFARGHIDHFAINFADRENFEEVRRRLIANGASRGRIRDFGMVQVMMFEDPDGMECELALWKDGSPLTMAESRVIEHDADGR